VFLKWHLSFPSVSKITYILDHPEGGRSISVNLDGWGSSDSELFNYEVKKTPKGKIEIVY
jgi:hypothetical protein